MVNARYHIEELNVLTDKDFNELLVLINIFHEKYNLIVPKTRIDQMANDPCKKLFVVRARSDIFPEEQIVAAALFSFIQTLCLNKGLISELIVLPHYRKQGIARELFRHCIKVCKEYDVDVIELIVHRDNISAISLYKSFGFDFSKYDYMRLIVLPWQLKERGVQ